MGLRVIFLDFDGTICGSRFWGHWADDAKYRKISERLQERLFKTNLDMAMQWMRGEHTAEYIMQRISGDIGVPAPELLAGLRESCQRMELYNEHILPAVRDLRQNGTKVVVASDNMDTFARWTIPALKLNQHFDDVLSSHSLKALKRDKDDSGGSKFFGAYFTKNKIDPATTVLIDDGAHNAVVEDFGMRFIHVTPALPAESILASCYSQS